MNIPETDSPTKHDKLVRLAEALLDQKPDDKSSQASSVTDLPPNIDRSKMTNISYREIEN